MGIMINLVIRTSIFYYHLENVIEPNKYIFRVFEVRWKLYFLGNYVEKGKSEPPCGRNLNRRVPSVLTSLTSTKGGGGRRPAWARKGRVKVIVNIIGESSSSNIV